MQALNSRQIQLQVENDYYTSGVLTAKNQQMRSLTAMNSVQVSSRATMLGRPAKTKHVSRERSPPLMQIQLSKKGKKSPH